MPLEQKKEKIKNYILDLSNNINYQHQGIITKDKIDKGIEMFTSSKYDDYTEEQIYEEINKLIQKMLEEQELQRQEFVKKMEEHKKEKFEELKKLYEQTREKYGNLQYEISRFFDVELMHSFNETKEVQLIGPSGEIVNGFYKGISSPNEYELLVSRLGKITDIPVADYSLYLNNGQIDGISISCIPDKDRYEFLSGYDFVKDYSEVSSVVQEIKDNPEKPRPELTRDQTQYYMDVLLKGFAEKVKNPVQLEKLKKDYFETVLFNLILDQKDYNYTNFAVLYDRVNDSYEMAPLFDNGAIKENRALEGTMLIFLGPSKKEDIIDLLYTEYYGYISDFSKKLEIEAQKMQNGEKNIISDMYACISDTLVGSEAVSYQQTVEQTLLTVLQREESKASSETKTEQSKEVTTPPAKETKKGFDQRSQYEVQIANQIKDKNKIIKYQKEQQRQKNKPKVKTLTQPSSSSSSTGNKGFANVITLSLIVSFVCGVLFMIVYMLIKG